MKHHALSPDCTRIPTQTIISSYASYVGRCLEFTVTGSTGGNVWGSDVYTADSAVARAAVHAGVVRTGETKIVRVKVLPGQSSYSSTSRNGVTTSNWGGYGLSYSFLGSASHAAPASSTASQSSSSGRRLICAFKLDCSDNSRLEAFIQ